MLYFVMIILAFFLRLILKLNWWATGGVALYLLFMSFFHRRLYREEKIQGRRFQEAGLYMDALLYAFLKDGKILEAFREVEDTLKEGLLKRLVGQAIEHMLLTFDEVELLKSAMDLVANEYRCTRISNIHNFMLHVEYYGGDIEQSVQLLLEDKSRWEQRINEARHERKQMFTQIIMSVAASVLICGLILYLPVMNMDISANPLVQALAVLVVVLDDLIILGAQRRLCVDYLLLDDLDEDNYYSKKMHEYRTYDERKDRRLSYGLSVIPLMGMGVAIYFHTEWGMAVALLFFLIFINQHRIGRSLARRNLTRYIRSSFPKWLLDLALLLQSENVHMAMYKSLNQVPAVLKEELEELIGRLEIDPESSEPYHNFLLDFEIPELHSAMEMLYAISMGNSRNAGSQVSELISRNLKMLDMADKERLHNKNSTMYLFFLAPVLTASFKLVVDMSVFLLSFLKYSVM